MSIPETLLEIREYNGAGYQPLIDYDTWRVAILRFIDDLAPQDLTKMQRHNETDEVFVLLSGRSLFRDFKIGHKVFMLGLPGLGVGCYFFL